MNAAPEKVLSKCPACGQQTFAYPHCEVNGCNWGRCRNKACELLYDMKLKRGTHINPQNPRGQHALFGNWTNPKAQGGTQ